jgi:hypothetical protein
MGDMSTAKFLLESLYTGKLTNLIVGTVSVDPASIGAGTAGNTDVTVTGLTTSHKVVAMCQDALEAGLIPLAAYVPTDGTLRIRLYNATGGAIDGNARTWFFIAWIP